MNIQYLKLTYLLVALFLFQIMASAQNNDLQTLKVIFGKVGGNYSDTMSYTFTTPASYGNKSIVIVPGNYPNFFNTSGNYEFKVQAVNSDGIAAPSGTPGSDNTNNKVFYYSKPPSGGGHSAAPSGTIVLNGYKSNTYLVHLDWNSVDDADFYKIYRGNVYVKTITNSHHPVDFHETDQAPPGNYNYLIKAGNTSSSAVVQSNTKYISVVSGTGQVGTIVGTIKDSDGERVEGVSVTFSHDGETIQSGLGNYQRRDIPYGASGTLSLSKYGYVFTPLGDNADYNISAGLTKIHFKAIKLPNTSTNDYTNVTPLDYELQLVTSIDNNLDVSHLKVGESYPFTIMVKNICTNSWSGDVSAILESQTGNHTLLGKQSISSLASGANTMLNFSSSNITDSPGSYNLFLCSYRNGSVNTSIKTVKPGELYENPVTATVEPSVSNMQSMEDMLGEIKDKLDNSATFTKVLGKMVDSYADGMNMNIGNNVYLELSGRLQEASGDLGEFNDIISGINEIDQALSQQDDFMKFWKLSKFMVDKLLGYSGIMTPAAKIISKYMEIPVEAKEAVDRICSKIYNNTTGVQIINAHLAIKVQKPKNWWQISPDLFSKNDFVLHIKNMEISGYCANTWHQNLNVPKKSSVGTFNDPSTVYGETENINDFVGCGPTILYLTLYWSNGRVSIVPLTTDFVKFGGGTLTDEITITFQSETNDATKIPLKLKLVLPQ